MKHKRFHKGVKRKCKHLAAAVAAGAAIMSSVVLAPVAAAAPPDASTPASENISAKQVLDIKATAYAPGAECNDQWGSKTYLGTQIRPGVIAVDPRIIPLGSRVLIKFPDGHSVYAIAEDTGGAIKGNRIDVAKWSMDEAKDFGIQYVKVYIIEKGTKS
ncbi:MAG: 3D domain-containing protein [Negativicutes bacterium]|nr:3D domain-containing protein [Negativicutes bacterium]